MSQNLDTHFFLGSNSGIGFYSLYDKFTDPEKDRLYILKGGPGCGKSTFMRRIAAAAQDEGLDVEYIHCSGDPDSLDAVYIPRLRIGYVDGTAPHVIEPVFAGAADNYVNLGAFYDTDALYGKKSEIISLNRRYKALYSRAYRLISAGAAAQDGKAVPLSEEVILAATKRARGIITREIKPLEKKRGKTSYRFLSALTCKGYVSDFDTVNALAERVCVLDNEFGLASLITEAVASAAEERGYDTIRCLDPISPDITEHVIIPELSLALISSCTRAPYGGPCYRHLRLDAPVTRSMKKSARNDLRTARKLSDMMFSEAAKILSEAKELHDQLEQIYNPHVDFEGVKRLADEHIAALFG